MNVTCPRCRQRVELPSATAGQSVVCPACGERFNATPAPVRPVRPVPQRRRGSGLGKLALGVLLIAAAAFGCVMFRFGGSPAVAWQRAIVFVETYRSPVRIDTPTPVPELESVPQATPTSPEPPAMTPPPAAVDPLVWLAAHKERWPREIVLKTAVTFPILYEGRAAGSGQAPPGSVVQLLGIDPVAHRLTVAFLKYGPGTQGVAPDETDLPERAREAMARADATRPAVASASVSPNEAANAAPLRPVKAASIPYAHGKGIFGTGVEINTILYANNNDGTTRLLPNGSTATLDQTSFGNSPETSATFNLGSFPANVTLTLKEFSVLTY